MVYTEKQLKQIKSNLDLISINAINVLKAIDNEPRINHNTIPDKSGLSKFVTDKCLSAFLVAGLIIRVDDGVKRFYEITEDGKAILKV